MAFSVFTLPTSRSSIHGSLSNNRLHYTRRFFQGPAINAYVPVSSHRRLAMARTAHDTMSTADDEHGAASSASSSSSSSSSTMMATVEEKLLPPRPPPHDDPASSPMDLFNELWRWVSSDKDTAYKFTLVTAILVTTCTLALQPDAIPDTVIPIPEIIERPPPIPPTMLQSLVQWASTPTITVSAALAVAAFTQAVCGFGFAIVSVGLLTQIPWIVNSSLFNDVQPIAAIVGAFVGSVLLLPDVTKVEWKPLWPLIISSSLAAPLGTYLVEYVDSGVTLNFIGAFILGFVVYSASGIELPTSWASKPAAYFFGTMAGLLGGAFDIQGPPLVFYANANKWEPELFRRNILATMIITSLVIGGVDAATGRLDSYYVIEFIRCSFPGVVGAILAGKLIGSRLNPAAFRNVILGVCAVMGIKLMAG